ncbi:uncharacterized protein LOC116659869 [Camelus ferus]|uniref:Uncharacterized protein LOC116659869 n=1 Tax=Camelus ferus TaxID=419612 RepID=A0A8B8S107_CAMFR|nr:uncharacterized protein LOC116659869 [Camelus ferus]
MEEHSGKWKRESTNVDSLVGRGHQRKGELPGEGLWRRRQLPEYSVKFETGFYCLNATCKSGIWMELFTEESQERFCPGCHKDNKGTHLGRFKEGLNISEPYLVYCEGWTTRLRLWLSSRREGNWKERTPVNLLPVTHVLQKIFWFLLYSFCLEHSVNGAGFFGSRSGIHEVRRKPRGLTIMSFCGSQIPGQVINFSPHLRISLYLLLYTAQGLLYLVRCRGKGASAPSSQKQQSKSGLLYPLIESTPNYPKYHQ